MFCALNGHELEVPPDEAVTTMLAIASGELDEVAVAAWLAGQFNTNTPR
jgi:prophage maintenance system killer protein